MGFVGFPEHPLCWWASLALLFCPPRGLPAPAPHPHRGWLFLLAALCCGRRAEAGFPALGISSPFWLPAVPTLGSHQPVSRAEAEAQSGVRTCPGPQLGGCGQDSSPVSCLVWCGPRWRGGQAGLSGDLRCWGLDSCLGSAPCWLGLASVPGSSFVSRCCYLSPWAVSTWSVRQVIVARFCPRSVLSGEGVTACR